ncbi:SVM family protein ['Fragaria x ananassa' phyllody phytoplasma]|uniref:SVM family protein n=1 Tax='Fragaria x ananassa' phyllody phytoplasma TaxID=2358428 RepID=A0ABS5K3X9_9MOLU|nr:SVM family protein ['Fragaria x ananassa' phyllody phytoplasma]MBS2126617.1 SVM family protein ['Fragaria x ananassa' phyllody phytoplasma]
MFQLKKQFKIIHLCLITFIGLLFIINNHQLIAMQNNKNKQILQKAQPTDEEVNDFFRLVKKQKEIIQNIKQKYPLLHNASVKEIEEWVCSDINLKTESQSSNKKTTNLDLNTIPEEK